MHDVAWDGSAVLEVTLRPAGHAPGVYWLGCVVSVTTPGVSGAAAVTASYSDAAAGAPAPVVAWASLGIEGQYQAVFDRDAVYSNGVDGIVLRLEPFGDLTGFTGRVRAVAARLG